MAIVDFLYCGEANIYQENLDAFLNIAEELDLKGLNGGEGDSEEGEREEGNTSNQADQPTIVNTAQRKKKNLPQQQIQPYIYESYEEDQDSSKMTIALPKDKFSGALEEK